MQKVGAPAARGVYVVEVVVVIVMWWWVWRARRRPRGSESARDERHVVVGCGTRERTARKCSVRCGRGGVGVVVVVVVVVM